MSKDFSSIDRIKYAMYYQDKVLSLHRRNDSVLSSERLKGFLEYLTVLDESMEDDANDRLVDYLDSLDRYLADQEDAMKRLREDLKAEIKNRKGLTPNK